MIRSIKKLMLIGRAPKTRAEIEALLLNELHDSEACQGAAAVSVVPSDEEASDANWTVAYYDIGTATECACSAALAQIVPRFQCFYELVQKH